MKRLLVAVGCVALLAVIAVAATQARWGGELEPYGNSVGMPVRLGSSFSVGMSELEPDRRIRIESIRLVRPTPGVLLVGALVHPTGRGMVGTERQFPPTLPGVRLRPAEGAVVRPRTPVVLVVGMRATRPGDFRVQGVDVLYRERWPGIDVRRRAHVGVEVLGCAVPASAKPDSHDC